MKKIFRIVKNNLACPEAFHPLWYRIEQRHTILFFIHWWGTPEFEPPHNFEIDGDAYNCIKEHYPNSVVYSLFSQKQWKPSKEQINHLRTVTEIAEDEGYVTSAYEVRNLIEQLKAL